MNEGVILVIVVAVLSVAYFVVAFWRHGNCDLGKVFTLAALVVGLVSGVFIFIHTFSELKAQPTYREDSIWCAVAGVLLVLYSVQQTCTMFRELFVQKIEPLK